jgi:hypothetical protein
MSLANELKHYGCELDAESFNDAMAELYHAIAPSLSHEELVITPEARDAFVRGMRARAACELPEAVILRRFLNLRKNGFPDLES